MGEILAWQTARSSLDQCFLRVVGFTDLLRWELDGSLNPQYKECGLWAMPQLVAWRRDGQVRIVTFEGCDKPAGLPPVRAKRALLDAAVVRCALERCGRQVSEVESWLVYQDRSRFELKASPEQCISALRRVEDFVKNFPFQLVKTEDACHQL